jgi:hypothetical protein
MPTPDDGVYVQFSGGAEEIFFGFELGLEREGPGGIVLASIESPFHFQPLVIAPAVLF